MEIIGIEIANGMRKIVLVCPNAKNAVRRVVLSKTAYNNRWIMSFCSPISVVKLYPGTNKKYTTSIVFDNPKIVGVIDAIAKRE
jgi:hypothetical protein